jgi:adenosylhomocysteine nucleosidase
MGMPHHVAPLGLLAAMPEEIDALRALIQHPQTTERARRVFTRGTLHGHDVVAVCSRWGKTAAASTATELIVAFGVDRIVFSGIAGSVSNEAHIGDIIVAKTLAHHDLDASPFFPRGHVPLLGVRELPTDEAMSRGLLDAATSFLTHDLEHAVEPALRAQIAAARHDLRRSPRAIRGDIASGDQVISTSSQRERVLQTAPSALCVEMEGAAVAQVCFEHSIPFACVRTISDAADEHLDASVAPFFAGVAGAYTKGIIGRWLTA